MRKRKPQLLRPRLSCRLKISATALNIEVYPKRNSFTLLGDKTQAFETMYCLELVAERDLPVAAEWASPCFRSSNRSVRTIAISSFG